MTATLDRNVCDHVPFQRVGELLFNPGVTGYGILGIDDAPIPSVTDDEPESHLFFAGSQPTSSLWLLQDQWPVHATTVGMATVVSRPSMVVGDRTLIPVFARIAEMSKLPQNWDGDDAEPPTATAIAEACHLIALVRFERLERGRQDGSPITSSPLPDGGLQVEWQGGKCRIDVQINSDGSLGFLTKCGFGTTAEYEEADDMPRDQIVELIHRVLDN